MSKEEMLRKLKGIHLLYSMPQLAQNMMPEHFAIVEYEKLAYEQQAIIDQLTNNWNELEEDINNKIKDIKMNFSQVNGNYFNMNYMIDAYEEVLDKMKEIKDGNNE